MDARQEGWPRKWELFRQPFDSCQNIKEGPRHLRRDRPLREPVVESLCLLRGLHWPQLLTPTSMNGRNPNVRREVTSGAARGRLTQGVSHAFAHGRCVQSLTLRRNEMRNRSDQARGREGLSVLNAAGLGSGVGNERTKLKRGRNTEDSSGKGLAHALQPGPRHPQTQQPCYLDRGNRPGQRCLEF